MIVFIEHNKHFKKKGISMKMICIASWIILTCSIAVANLVQPLRWIDVFIFILFTITGSTTGFWAAFKFLDYLERGMHGISGAALKDWQRPRKKG